MTCRAAPEGNRPWDKVTAADRFDCEPWRSMMSRSGSSSNALVVGVVSTSPSRPTAT